MKPSISIIVPALNEEKNLRPTVETILSAVNNSFSKFEIIIFDDNSSDFTLLIAEELRDSNKNIKVVHNDETMGFGYNFKKGVELAQNDYITIFPGDNDLYESSIIDIVKLIGSADCIISYTTNIPCDRPLWRRIISRCFTMTLNTIFGLGLRYYNGVVIHRADIIKDLTLTTYGFAFQAEALIKILKSGHSFTEVGIELKGRKYGTTKAFNIKNAISVLKTVAGLFSRIYIRERDIYSDKPKRI
ncbi:MAG: glycosyltransferase family 2 protein [Candidatus Omnitrophota bacterium]